MFYAIFSKGCNFCDFFFPDLEDKTSVLFKKKNLRIEKGNKNKKDRVFFFLKTFHFTLQTL